MSLVCTFEWMAGDWVQRTFCAEGTCQKPDYNGNTNGEYGYTPCSLG